MAGIRLDLTGGGPPMASILINPDSNGQHMLPAEVPFALQPVVEQSQWAGFASQVNARLATELAESKSPCFRLLTVVSYIPTFVFLAGILASFVIPIETQMDYFDLVSANPGLIPLVVLSILVVGVGGKYIEGRARIALFSKTFEDLDQICDQHGARIPNVTLAVVDNFRLAQAMGQPQMPAFLQGIVTNMRGRMLILMAQGTGITPTPMVGAMGMQMQAGPVLMQNGMRPLQIQPPQQLQFLGMAGAGQMQMPLQQQQQQVPGFSGFQQQQQPGFPGMAGMAQNPMQQPGLPDFQQQQQTGFSGFQQQPGFSGFQPQQQQQGFAGY